jgi:large subunit ribosomal protein L20
MIKVNTALNKKKRHRKILNLAKGFKGSQSKLFKIANQRVLRSLKYSYIGRKKKKSDYKSLWINRINIICQKKQTKYNILRKKLKMKNILINSKVLANLLLLDKTIEKNLFLI